MTGGMHYFFSSDITPEMLKLGRVSKVKVFFPVLVYVFKINLFEFSAAILEKSLLTPSFYGSQKGHNTQKVARVIGPEESERKGARKKLGIAFTKRSPNFELCARTVGVRRAELAITNLISNKREWNNCFIKFGLGNYN